jgi:2,3-diketo-5-methylthio-1-phosphopentane phosphatase
VTLKLPPRTRAIVLDIEGTTTPIAFVHEVLFPYARRSLATYLSEYARHEDGRRLIASFRDEWRADQAKGEPVPAGPGGSDEVGAVVRYAEWLMDRDRKSPALKELQGQIWARGYAAGELRGDVFSDVPKAFGLWNQHGIDVAIYSSGSVLAQKLLFGSNNECDLTPLIKAYFDTGVGAKTSVESYVRIAAELKHDPPQILFVSDMARELAAARGAGFQVALSLRPVNAPQSIDDEVPRIGALDDVVPAPTGHREVRR